MRRFIASLALLAIIVLAGCEKLDSPVSPSQEQQQVKTTLSPELQAKTAKFKEDAKTWKAKVEARAAALQNKAVAYKQSPLAKSAAANIVVPDDYPTIQEAVDAAAPGSKIVVENGDYTEEVDVFTDNLTIVAEHEGKAHVIGGFGFGGVTKGTLQGFEISGGIFLEGCSKVVIRENEVRDGFGIILIESVNCEVKNNKVHDTFDGIFVPSNISIFFGEKNLVKDNNVQASFVGILVYGGVDGEESAGRNTISGNTCTGNLYGLVLDYSDKNEVKNNRCNSNFILGIYLIFSDENTVGPDNKANENEEVGIVLELSDDNTVRRNQAKDNFYCDVIDVGVDNKFVNNKFGSFNCP